MGPSRITFHDFAWGNKMFAPFALKDDIPCVISSHTAVNRQTSGGHHLDFRIHHNKISEGHMHATEVQMLMFWLSILIFSMTQKSTHWVRPTRKEKLESSGFCFCTNETTCGWRMQVASCWQVFSNSQKNNTFFTWNKWLLPDPLEIWQALHQRGSSKRQHGAHLYLRLTSELKTKMR